MTHTKELFMVIKKIPEDFVVQEVLVWEYSTVYSGQPYMLMYLNKKGWSTLDAVKYIEGWFGIGGISTAGQKDSDGITTQKISVPIKDLSLLECLDDFNKEAHVISLGDSSSNQSDRDISGKSSSGQSDRDSSDESSTRGSFINLSLIGYCDEPLRSSHLEGNVFKLRLRNMDPEKASAWLDTKSYSLVFPNYYDKQRFGMPGYKHVTHLIGKALSEKDYKSAYEYVMVSGASEANLPFDGDYEKFFDQIDPRVMNMYDSALFSYEFNTRLGDILESGGPVLVIEDEGIEFRMPAEKKALVPLMAADFPEEQLGDFSTKPLQNYVPRKLIVSTVINFLDSSEDEFYPGRSVLTVSFFLPMGAYATMAIKQLEIFM